MTPAAQRSDPPRDTPRRSGARRPALSREERERIVLDTAARLFYARGIRAVGMDELIAAAGLSKMSVYRIHPTKDHLVEAYLSRLSAEILGHVDADVAAHPGDPAGALLAVLAAVERDLRREGFRGCPFGNAGAAFDDASHPARRIAREYRELLRRRLVRLASRLGPGGAALGDRLAVLIDGAYLSAAHLGPDGPAREGLALARALVEQARETAPAGKGAEAREEPDGPPAPEQPDGPGGRTPGPDGPRTPPGPGGPDG